MSGQLQQPNAKVAATNIANYRSYKDSVDLRDKEVELDEGATIKTQIKRTLRNGINRHPAERYNAAMKSPEDALARGTRYYLEHQEEIIQDAIHDATAVGKAPNLPDNSLPGVAINIEPLPVQEQQDS